jgi:hypothetical protein
LIVVLPTVLGCRLAKSQVSKATTRANIEDDHHPS